MRYINVNLYSVHTALLLPKHCLVHHQLHARHHRHLGRGGIRRHCIHHWVLSVVSCFRRSCLTWRSFVGGDSLPPEVYHFILKRQRHNRLHISYDGDDIFSVVFFM